MPEGEGASAPFDFECRSCGWSGTRPVLDAHLNPWCPTCGRPAEFGAIARMRRGEP
ncbi:MAG TPA: hypothetical protein VFH78_04265 [Candidatus Thermoplasmatota archaeon]|nr:hypothetical protein [Candidatus Thermoplasmatota archaeon]